jgi:lipocalin
MDNFDMNKFLGRWYVIQKFSTASSCWTYDFIRNSTDGSLKIVQSRDHVILDTIGFDNNYRYTGSLDVPDNNRPGFMRVRFPMSLAGKADYVVFATDYDNFGAIYSCQSILFGHRRTASILSRRRTLDQIYINKVRTKLEGYGVDAHDFSIIEHTDCKTLPSDSLLNVEVGPNTFSTSNVVNVVKGAGNVIASGIETAVEGVGQIYNRYAGNSSEIHPDRDAEMVTGNRVQLNVTNL